MAQVTFSGSSGTIANLNQNFTQLYELRELISTPGYTAATPKLTIAAGGGVTFAARVATSSIVVSGSPSGSIAASTWLTQDEGGVIRSYYCGPSAGSYQSWEIYRATSTGAAQLSMTFNAAGAIAVAPPASGTAFVVTGVGGALAASFASGPTKLQATTVAGLLAAATAGNGARANVTDATATTFASIVAGGGANAVPVYSDGTNWKIG